MNKTEWIAAVAEKTGMTKKDTELAVSAALEEIANALSNGEKVQIAGFGSFEVKERAARTGLNPKTREPITIEASKAPAFKAGKVLKERVAK